MCGRFTLKTSREIVANLLDLAEILELPPRYNIAPTQSIAAVRLDAAAARELVLLRWGLIPSWADDPSIGSRLLNARAETAATKPSFRAAFRARRCLILADGFYEWQKIPGGKQPFYIRMQDDAPFAFAGLWEHWQHEDKTIESCTILTTAANKLMRPLHDRMPVILPRDTYRHWLDPGCDDREMLMQMMRPYPAEDMLAYCVSTLVNKYQNDNAKCVAPYSEI